jgi:hypothetical protein
MVALGRTLIVVGVLVTVVGVVLAFGPRLPGASWIGRLPGDIYVDRPNLKVFLPLGTCLVASVLLSLIVYIFRR